jgi:hypothetical protein
MSRQNARLVLAVVLVVAVAALAAAALGHAQDLTQRAAGVIQYKLVPVPNTQAQAQLQAVLTAQGNAGFRLLLPYAVGTGPIPSQTVLGLRNPRAARTARVVSRRTRSTAKISPWTH